MKTLCLWLEASCLTSLLYVPCLQVLTEEAVVGLQPQRCAAAATIGPRDLWTLLHRGLSMVGALCRLPAVRLLLPFIRNHISALLF